jgi:hypothetical protein
MEIECDRRGERVVLDGVEYHVPKPVLDVFMWRGRRIMDLEAQIMKLGGWPED